MTIRALAVLPQNTRGMPFEEVKKINQTYTLAALRQIEEARAAKQQKGTFRFLYISGPDTPRTPDGPTPPVFKEYIRLKVRGLDASVTNQKLTIDSRDASKSTALNLPRSTGPLVGRQRRQSQASSCPTRQDYSCRWWVCLPA